jgi:hypothetical protein
VTFHEAVQFLAERFGVVAASGANSRPVPRPRPPNAAAAGKVASSPPVRSTGLPPADSRPS